ncbi:hypothetical protein J6590_104930 [Homalodisca vitripennis]|nr:hypothetical protein J6590_104930 [Homalodisca vitripennis]
MAISCSLFCFPTAAEEREAGVLFRIITGTIRAVKLTYFKQNWKPKRPNLD